MDRQRRTHDEAARRYPIGAELLPDGTGLFRVWAPKCRRVEVVFPVHAGQAKELAIELGSEPGGYFSGSRPGLAAGMAYGFRLDGRDRLLPDPASRFQPRGPRGPSLLVDPRAFVWGDTGWNGVQGRQVIYEMHVGTFTREGTWRAAAAEIDELARVGMTLIEVMPVADFAGQFGWGYDGVSLFAPTRLYGSPDDFRFFVDRAHAAKLGVILDVVYNHFGTVDWTLSEFSDWYTSRRYKNDWGGGVNFDDEHSQPVREFFLANVACWIDEFHLDGLRFDATQSIRDSSDPHILTEMVAAARQAAGTRTLFLVTENEPQDVRMIIPQAAGGHGMDAAWNDDFHHAAMVRLTGHNEAYYSDYQGRPEELLAALKHGFIYQGQFSQWQRQPRGTPTAGIPQSAFVTFIQNHDQVANSLRGERIDRLTSPGRLRAMTALWLLAPQTPLFFQGQEFGASAPFVYFADHSGDDAALTARGRADFLKQFPSLSSPQVQSQLPEPSDRANFERSKLDLAERKTHAEVYSLHRDLLRLRREDPVFARQPAPALDGAPLGPDALVVRCFAEDGHDRLLLVNFGCDLKLSPVPQPLLAPPAGCRWQLLWSSSALEYGGLGTPPLETETGWLIPGEATIVLTAAPRDQCTNNAID